jgi:hypothetical protein
MSAHSYIIRNYNPFVVEYHDFNSYNVKLESYKYPLTHAEIRAEMPFITFEDVNLKLKKAQIEEHNESYEDYDLDFDYDI